MSREVFDCLIIVLLAWSPKLKHEWHTSILYGSTFLGSDRHRLSGITILIGALCSFTVWLIIPMASFFYLIDAPSLILALFLYMLGIALLLHSHFKNIHKLECFVEKNKNNKEYQRETFWEEETEWDWNLNVFNAYCMLLKNCNSSFDRSSYFILFFCCAFRSNRKTF